MITIYAKDATVFYNNGLGVLLPDACTVREEANGLYELDITHPMDEERRYTLIEPERIVRVPVPKRYTPFVDLYGVTSTITYTVSTAGALYAHNSASSPQMEWLTIGQTVTLLKAGDPYYLVATASGETGFVLAVRLTYDAEAPSPPDEALQAFLVRPQLFRIYRVEKDTESGKVSAWARHIFYDLGWHGIRVCNISTLTLAQDALTAIDAQIRPWHSFDFYTDSNWKMKRDWSRRNAVEVLLDPDEGFVHYRTPNLQICRDNYNAFFLRAGGRSRNDPLMHGKNLLGVRSEVTYENTYNRIHPIGQDVNGDPLYTASPTYIVSPNYVEGDVIRTKIIEYNDVKVGDEDDDGTPYTVATARAELEARALAEFAAGMDKPEYNLSVNFVLLGDTEEYAAYQALDRLYLYDIIDVIDSLHGIDIRAAVTAYEWDALTGRYLSLTLGRTYGKAAARVVSGYQLRDSTVPGHKITQTGIDISRLAETAIKGVAQRTITKSDVAPETPYVGQVWMDTTTDMLYRYAGEDTWVNVKANELHTLTLDAGNFGFRLKSGGNITILAGGNFVAEAGGSFDLAAQDFAVTNINNGQRVLGFDENGLDINAASGSVSGALSAGTLQCEDVRGNVVNTYMGTAIDFANTLQATADNIPKYLMQEVGVTIPTGTYNDDLILIGLKGQKLTISFEAGVVINGSILISGCDMVRLYTSALGNVKISKDTDVLLTVLYSNVEVVNLTLTGKAATTRGIYASYSRVVVTTCEINNCTTYCVQSVNGSNASTYNCKGGGTGRVNAGYAGRVELGGNLIMAGTQPVATSGRTSVGTTGGIITEFNPSSVAGGVAAPTTTTANLYNATGYGRMWTTDRRLGTSVGMGGTVSWGGWAYRSASDWAAGVLRQGIRTYAAGIYDDLGNNFYWRQDRDVNYGIWIFGAFAGGTVTAGRLTVTRYASGGTSPATVTVYRHGYTSLPGGHSAPTMAATSMTKSMALGETYSFALDATTIGALNAGTTKGFGVYASGAYLMMAAAAKLELVYA